MPIRNMGTLLENIVLVEAMRLLTHGDQPNAPIDFINSFAMPVLSNWVPHRTDYGFSAAQLDALRAGPQPSPVDSYQGMMWSCLQQPLGQPGTQVPNGALLCAMLAMHLNWPMRLWLYARFATLSTPFSIRPAPRPSRNASKRSRHSSAKESAKRNVTS